MSDYETLPLQQKLNRAAHNKAVAAIQQTGRALPCTVTAVNGSFVTVKFEVQSVYTLPPLTLPKAEGAWLRSPTQNGDVGLTLPADASLGGISGLGGGVAQLGVNEGNLGTLVWVPVASAGFAAVPRSGIVWANGPHGARMGDSANAAYVDCDNDTGTVTIHAGGQSWTFTSMGLTLATGIVAELHAHGGVQGGSSDTGPPIP